MCRPRFAWRLSEFLRVAPRRPSPVGVARRGIQRSELNICVRSVWPGTLNIRDTRGYTVTAAPVPSWFRTQWSVSVLQKR